MDHRIAEDIVATAEEAAIITRRTHGFVNDMDAARGIAPCRYCHRTPCRCQGVGMDERRAVALLLCDLEDDLSGACRLIEEARERLEHARGYLDDLATRRADKDGDFWNGIDSDVSYARRTLAGAAGDVEIARQIVQEFASNPSK